MADLLRHPLSVVTIKTKLGPLRVESSTRGVTSLTFRRCGIPAASGFSKRAAIPDAAGMPRLRRIAFDLRRYAAGQIVRFKIPLDLSSGTPFQQSVWRALLKIPRGQTRSYAWVAQQIRRPRAMRAVGAACGANPIPIIVPCHRVIASDGSLGGFSGGLQRKRNLLRLEGVRV